MKRIKENEELVQILSQLIKENPDLRLNQILVSFGFIKTDLSPLDQSPLWVNEFYTEPTVTLARVKKILAERK